MDWCCTEIGWSPTVSLFEIFEHLTTSCYNLHRSKAFPGAPTGRGVALELAGKITRSFTCSQLVSKCTKNALLQKLFLRLRCNDRVNTAVFMIWRPRQIQMLSYKHIYIYIYISLSHTKNHSVHTHLLYLDVFCVCVCVHVYPSAILCDKYIKYIFYLYEYVHVKAPLCKRFAVDWVCVHLLTLNKCS